MTKNIESRLRRHAVREGLLLTKIRESSRWYNTYGPYALVDQATNFLVAYGLDLDEVEEQITAQASPA